MLALLMRNLGQASIDDQNSGDLLTRCACEPTIAGGPTLLTHLCAAPGVEVGRRRSLGVLNEVHFAVQCQSAWHAIRLGAYNLAEVGDREVLTMATPELKTYFQTFQTDQLGQIFLTGILNVQSYSKVNLEIIQWPHAAVNMTVLCDMGKLSGETLGQTVGQFALGTAGQIHTFEVVGPEFSVILTGGPPSTQVPIEAWVFLR